MSDLNPFANKDEDKAQIWEMLVRRDIDAFVTANWPMVADDFLTDDFFGVDADNSADVASWSPKFDSLAFYKHEWLKQANEARVTFDQSGVRAALFNLTDLGNIKIKGNSATAHKCFDGVVKDTEGNSIYHKWQTLYFCKKINNRWKIKGFVGYMPYPLIDAVGDEKPVIEIPEAELHDTAGPYSAVLKINNPGKIIVICGQAALNLQGEVVGDTIEEQTKVTLDNCLTQLQNANCDFGDVFKVNVYLTDLDEWPRFNTVYEKTMSKPYPVRTAVQAGLLLNFKVEIEMWAVKK